MIKVLVASLISLLVIAPAFGQDGYIGGEPSLAYWKVGNSKETIIVLHGGPGVAHQYLRPEWDKLNSAGQIIYYDQRGCGKSEKAACYAWREQVQDLKRVIDTFSEGEKVILAGSSWGSDLAILYTYTFPQDVKGMILSGTTPWNGLGQDRKDCQHYQDVVISGAVNNDVKQFKEPKENESEQERFERLKELEIAPPEVLSQVFNSMKEAPSLAQLKAVKVPVLLFNGNTQCHLLDGSSKYMTIFNNAELHTIDGACHDPWFINPNEFFATCLTFIKKIQ